MREGFDWDNRRLQYPLLKKHINVRVSKGRYIVGNCRTGDSVLEDKRKFMLLLLCNGVRTLEEVMEIYEGIFEAFTEEAEEQVQETLNKYAGEIAFYRSAQKERNIFDLARLKTSALWEYSPLRDTYPYRLTIALTQYCNHKCDYCFNSCDSSRKQEVKAEEWIRVIEQAHAIGVQEITFTGGEPFLYRDFLRLVAFCSEKGIYVKISTNGTFLDEGMVRALRRAGAEYIHVSLPAVTETVYDKITESRQDLEKVKRAVRLLKQYGFYIRVKMVLTPNNENEVEGLLAFCAAHGVDFVHLAPYVLTENSRGGRSLLLGEEALKKVRRTAEAGRRMYGGMRISEIPDVCGRWSGPQDIAKCGGIKDSLTILSDGRITFCEALGDLDEFVLGRIQENSLEEIWNSYKPDRITCPDNKVLDAACEECEYLERCQTGCFVFSHMQTGNPWSMDPRCFRFFGANNIFDRE